MDTINFIKRFPVVTFSKGQLLLAEGDVAQSLYAIREGFVKVTSIDESGKENVLWIEGRYDTVPTEKFFSTREPVKFFYTALTDGSYYDIDKKQFLKQVAETPELLNEVAQSMSHHYDDLLRRIAAIEYTSVRQRLTATLGYLAEKLSARSSVDLFAEGLRLTHSDLASLISSTRETISLELNKLKNDGIIEYDQTKFIIHLDRLKKEAPVS